MEKVEYPVPEKVPCIPERSWVSGGSGCQFLFSMTRSLRIGQRRMDTQLLSSSTVILCSSTKSEQNLGLVTSPAHSAGSPRQPFLGPTSCTQDWFSGLCSGPCAVLADEQGQSQKPMHLSLNQSHFFFRREGGRMQSCSSQKKVGVSLCWVRMDGWRQTGHGSSRKSPW